jgi:hypothetical protein
MQHAEYYSKSILLLASQWKTTDSQGISYGLTKLKKSAVYTARITKAFASTGAVAIDTVKYNWSKACSCIKKTIHQKG